LQEVLQDLHAAQVCLVALISLVLCM